MPKNTMHKEAQLTLALAQADHGHAVLSCLMRQGFTKADLDWSEVEKLEDRIEQLRAELEAEDHEAPRLTKVLKNYGNHLARQVGHDKLPNGPRTIATFRNGRVLIVGDGSSVFAFGKAIAYTIL